MSVPLHNLYDYIHQCLEKKFYTAYFYPHGQKSLDNLFPMQEIYDSMYYKKKQVGDDLLQYTLRSDVIDIKKNIVSKIFPVECISKRTLIQYSPWLICHDQEPLIFDFYQNEENFMEYIKTKSQNRNKFIIDFTENLRWLQPTSYQQKWILLHSELNSTQVKKYEATNKFVCAYWWTHALISLDWYRYAQYDCRISYAKQLKKRFLIYARDNTGSRQYRKTLLQQLQHLEDNIQVGSFFEESSAESSASYNVDDFNYTGISIIAETVFDERIHLTEKICRSLALGHPFILLSGSHALEELKKYGFKTFYPYIDESYDLQQDTEKRQALIVNEIGRLSHLPNTVFTECLAKCREIAQHNKKVFFSSEFQNQVVQQGISNVEDAYSKTQNTINFELIWEQRKFRKKQNSKYFHQDPKRKYEILLLKHLKKGGTIDNYVPPWKD